MQQGKKDSYLTIDNISNSSKSINSNSISSIEINISKIYEVIEDENVNENRIIDDDLDINSPPREKRVNSLKVTESPSSESSKRRKGIESSTPKMDNIKRPILPLDEKKSPPTIPSLQKRLLT